MEFKGTLISYQQHFSHTCHKIMWHTLPDHSF